MQLLVAIFRGQLQGRFKKMNIFKSNYMGGRQILKIEGGKEEIMN